MRTAEKAVEAPDEPAGSARADHGAGVGGDGTTSGTVAERLRQAIRAGELLPGVQLRQTDWADRLGVSRVPVREALNVLESEGLLSHLPHQGYFVTALSEDEIRQLYLLRQAVDRLVVATVDWPDSDQLVQLRELSTDADGALARFDVAGWLTLNDRFITLVYDLCPDRLVVSEAVRLWRRAEAARAQRVHRVFASAARGRIQSSAQRILDALERRDRPALQGAMESITADPVLGT